jgi:acyl-CoA thioester hydrolase
MEAKPEADALVYDGLVDVRFNDLDPYGHVNSGVYVEYVVTSRWRYMVKRFGISPDDFVKKGLAFYVRQVTVRYRRAIEGVGTVYVASHVSLLKRSDIHVEFRIRSEDRSVLHAEGSFEFVTIDLATRRPVEVPDWVKAYFFSGGDLDKPAPPRAMAP